MLSLRETFKARESWGFLAISATKAQPRSVTSSVSLGNPTVGASSERARLKTGIALREMVHGDPPRSFPPLMVSWSSGRQEQKISSGVRHIARRRLPWHRASREDCSVGLPELHQLTLVGAVVRTLVTASHTQPLVAFCFGAGCAKMKEAGRYEAISRLGKANTLAAR